MTKKFESPELLALSQEADLVISAHVARLDRISSDIKLLEDTLHKAALPFTFVHTLFSKKFDYRINEENYPNHDAYSKLFTVTIADCDDPRPYRWEQTLLVEDDHCLVWSQTSKGARLSYTVYRHHATEPCDVSEKLPPTLVISSVPLIETKAIFRLSIEKELPHLYTSIINTLKIFDPQSDFCFSRSISYKREYLWEVDTKAPLIERRYGLLRSQTFARSLNNIS